MPLAKIGWVIMLLGLNQGLALPTGAPPGRAHKAAQAADRTIAAGVFRFQIVRIAFDATAMGFAPEDTGPGDRMMFVECELRSGKRDDFMGLAVVLDSGEGRRSKPVALISGGMMKALTSLTIKTASYEYRPEKSNIAWVFVVRKTEGDFRLVFPTGPVVSLAPWLRDGRPPGDHSRNGPGAYS